ncbi:MAG: histidinol dehydrogenase [Dehalococcoidia bacterium]
MRVAASIEEARRTFLERAPASAELPEAMAEVIERVFGQRLSAEEVVRRIVDEVRRDGDTAVRRFNLAFDGVDAEELEVDTGEMEKARQRLEPSLRGALEFAAGRIRSYHEEQLAHAARNFFSDGRGQRVTAVERAGIYVPGTAAVYPSSVLMTAIPAEVAGVGEIIMATPAGSDGCVSPLKLAAAAIAGVDRVFRISGAQAIAALAQGTESVPRVDKIYGPGGLFVTLAKRAVFGQVGIDSIYGPSETIVVIDESADPALAAADLLAQAEHDELATPILFSTSQANLDATLREVERQVITLPREQIARTALQRQGGALLVKDVEEAIELANEYAPEHLCLNVIHPDKYVELVRNAGAIFVGEVSPEAIGDYTAGPSHVMPTGRAARFSGALGVHDFLKVTSVIKLDSAMTKALGEQGAIIAHAEGFGGHAAAMERRLHRESAK